MHQNLPAGHLLLAGLAVVLMAAGCATTGPSQPGVVPARDTVAYKGVPGFDTRVYPGDSAMARWRRESPYRWVGYYLPAPCHTDSSWVGRRAALERIGWGTALIFTGEQDWGAAATVHGPSVRARAAAGSTPPAAGATSAGAAGTASGAPAGAAATAAQPQCTRTNLTADQARADAATADSATAAEGFPAGSHVYLDVEPVDSVSTPLAAYVAAWTRALLERGRYLAGIYAHARNADSLRAVVSREYAARGIAAVPRFWIAGGAASFDVHEAPGGSAVPYANIWQGVANRNESWGGSSMRIDVNVADLASPSAPSSAAPGPVTPGGGGSTR